MRKEEPMRNINPFGLRMQPELKAKIEAAAEKNRRSINAEIHARLEESFAPRTMDEVESTHAHQLDREIAELSMESMRLGQAMNELLDRGRAATGNKDRVEIDKQFLEVAEKLGKLEGVKYRKMKMKEAFSG